MPATKTLVIAKITVRPRSSKGNYKAVQFWFSRLSCTVFLALLPAPRQVSMAGRTKSYADAVKAGSGSSHKSVWPALGTTPSLVVAPKEHDGVPSDSPATASVEEHSSIACTSSANNQIVPWRDVAQAIEAGADEDDKTWYSDMLRLGLPGPASSTPSYCGPMGYVASESTFVPKLESFFFDGEATLGMSHKPVVAVVGPKCHKLEMVAKVFEAFHSELGLAVVEDLYKPRQIIHCGQSRHVKGLVVPHTGAIFVGHVRIRPRASVVEADIYLITKRFIEIALSCDGLRKLNLRGLFQWFCQHVYNNIEEEPHTLVDGSKGSSDSLMVSMIHNVRTLRSKYYDAAMLYTHEKYKAVDAVGRLEFYLRLCSDITRDLKFQFEFVFELIFMQRTAYLYRLEYHTKDAAYERGKLPSQYAKITFASPQR